MGCASAIAKAANVLAVCHMSNALTSQVALPKLHRLLSAAASRFAQVLLQSVTLVALFPIFWVIGPTCWPELA